MGTGLLPGCPVLFRIYKESVSSCPKFISLQQVCDFDQKEEQLAVTSLIKCNLTDGVFYILFWYIDQYINTDVNISIYRNFCTNNLKKFSLIKLNWAFISVRITVKGWLVGRGVEKTGLPRELEIRLFIPVAPYSSLTRESSSFTYQMKTKIILEVFTVKPSKWWYQSEYIILAWHQPHSHTLQEEKLENVV